MYSTTYPPICVLSELNYYQVVANRTEALLFRPNAVSNVYLCHVLSRKTTTQTGWMKGESKKG